jgi:hypothetical protein
MCATNLATGETFEAQVLQSAKTVLTDRVIGLDGPGQSRQFQSYSTRNPDHRAA